MPIELACSECGQVIGQLGLDVEGIRRAMVVPTDRSWGTWEHAPAVTCLKCTVNPMCRVEGCTERTRAIMEEDNKNEVDHRECRVHGRAWRGEAPAPAEVGETRNAYVFYDGTGAPLVHVVGANLYLTNYDLGALNAMFGASDNAECRVKLEEVE